VPLPFDNRVLNLFIIIATIGSHNDITRIIGTYVILQVEVGKIIDDQIMLALVVKTMLSAIRFTIKLDGRKWNQYIIDD